MERPQTLNWHQTEWNQVTAVLSVCLSVCLLVYIL